VRDVRLDVDGFRGGGVAVSGAWVGVVDSSTREGREDVYAPAPDTGENELGFSVGKSAKRDVRCWSWEFGRE